MSRVGADVPSAAGPACPDEARLRLLLEPEADAEARPGFAAALREVCDHVDGCDGCQRRLQALADLEPEDCDWHEPAAVPAGASDAPEPEVDGFVERLWQQFRAPARAQQYRGALAAVRVAADAAGLGTDRVGPYRIERCAGWGGMSVVYQATDTRLDRAVALKMLGSRPGDGSGPRRERLVREAAVLARLSHPNLVPLYEVGEHRGQLYLVLEFVAGPTLAHWAHRRVLPAAEAAAAVETLARAVQEAHAQGVIHRDLKPGNILLRPPADAAADPEAPPLPLSAYRLMVADFGLARWRDEESERLTVSGQPVGTPAYMAPEQVQDRGAIGPATDVYALGAILYELLTGRPPLLADTVLGTYRLIEGTAPVRPRLRVAALPRDLETITLKCLEKDPGRRYATAAELADDLARFRAHRPILARPPGRVGRLWRWGRRNRGLAALMTLSAGLLLALAVGGPLAALNQRALRRESDRLRALAEIQARQAQDHRAQSRADLERATEALKQLGNQLLRIGPNPDPSLAALRDQSFLAAIGFAQQHLALAGPPDQWSDTDLRVALTLIQMDRLLGRTEASLAVRAPARAAGERLAREQPGRHDIVMPLAGSHYNEGLHHFYAHQPAEARDSFGRCVALLDRFLAARPPEADALQLRARGAWGLAQSLLELDQARPSAPLAEEAVALLEANLALLDAHRPQFPDTPEQARDEATQAGSLARLLVRLGRPRPAVAAADRALAALAPLPDAGPTADDRRRLLVDALTERRRAHEALQDPAAVLADLERLEPLIRDPIAARIARIQQAETLLLLDQPDRAAALARALASDPLAATDLALPLSRLLALRLAHPPAPPAPEADALARAAVTALEAGRSAGRLDPIRAHQALTDDPAFAALRARPELQPLLQSLAPSRPR